MEQLSIFDLTMPYILVDKPIRLLEVFAGIGSQAMGLRDLGANFEHYRMIEFDEHAVRSYNAIHGTNFPVTDIRDVHGEDLEIVDKDTFTYLLTYSFPCQDLSAAGKSCVIQCIIWKRTMLRDMRLHEWNGYFIARIQ